MLANAELAWLVRFHEVGKGTDSAGGKGEGTYFREEKKEEEEEEGVMRFLLKEKASTYYLPLLYNFDSSVGFSPITSKKAGCTCSVRSAACIDRPSF